MTVSGFPASISVLFLNIKTPVTEISSPETISNHSIVTKSATGPKKIIPNGIITLEIIPKTPNTLPIKFGSILSCRKTVTGTLKIGNATPTIPMKNRYSQKNGVSPSANVKAPMIKVDSAIE